MNENEKKQSNSKTLSLRGSGGSSVRMNLSHGRSKSVLIETKRKKIILTNKNSPSLKERNTFKLEDSNKTNEKVFTEEEIDRRKKAIEAAREREILLKEEQEKLKKEKVLENENRIIDKEEESYKKVDDKIEIKTPEEQTSKNKNKQDPYFD